MKAQHFLLLLFVSSLLLNSKCRKENELQLPPETTTGAMTFGCKINGKILIPKGGNGFPGILTEYPFLGNGPGGGWFLSIIGTDRKSEGMPAVSIATDSLLLVEGNTYNLEDKKGHANAEHFSGLFTYKIFSPNSGVLTITKHNQSLRILSGRFSFTATNSNGEKVNITEGRFDVRY